MKCNIERSAVAVWPTAHPQTLPGMQGGAGMAGGWGQCAAGTRPGGRRATSLPKRWPAGSRRGITLTETLVTMMVASVMLLLGTQLLQQVLRTDRGLQRQGQLARQLGGLESQFRHDLALAHAAELVTPQPNTRGGSTLRLIGPGGGQVEYTAEVSRLIRRETLPGGEVRQRVYPLPAGSTWELEYAADQQRAVLRAWHRLRERTAGGAAEEPRREFRISGGLGQDWVVGRPGGEI